MAIKAWKSNSSEDDEYVAYLSKKFMKAMKRNERFHMKGNNSRPAGANNLWHKYDKLGYFIKDYPLHKMDYEEYMKSRGDKGIKNDWVPNKSIRKA